MKYVKGKYIVLRFENSSKKKRKKEAVPETSNKLELVSIVRPMGTSDNIDW